MHMRTSWLYLRGLLEVSEWFYPAVGRKTPRPPVMASSKPLKQKKLRMALDLHFQPEERRMQNEGTVSATAGWKSREVFALAAICLALGLLMGYLLRGSATAKVAAKSAPSETIHAGMAKSAGEPKMPSLDDMKRMADKAAEPLLAKLKADPNNVDLMLQVAGVYKSTHQFKTAAEYYDRALKVDPKKVATRDEMASCLYYAGDVDGAISQLQLSLKDDPKDVNALFNLGMIRWKGKNDADGAIAAWQQLLKTNPKLDKKPIVEKMIAEAKLHPEGK